MQNYQPCLHRRLTLCTTPVPMLPGRLSQTHHLHVLFHSHHAPPPYFQDSHRVPPPSHEPGTAQANNAQTKPIDAIVSVHNFSAKCLAIVHYARSLLHKFRSLAKVKRPNLHSIKHCKQLHSCHICIDVIKKHLTFIEFTDCKLCKL